jgi:5-methylcytosine-specific restriction endonuclease McrA
MNKTARLLADHVRCCPSATPREQAAARAALSQGRGPVKREIATVAFVERRRAEDEVALSAADAEAYKAVKRRDRGCTVQLPESIMGPCSGPLQIDHQWGRGKEPTRAENCRRLCEGHHRRKTDGKPSRRAWLLDYGEHALSCADRGLGAAYFAELDRAGRMAQLEIAQHPEQHDARAASRRTA